MNKNVINKYVVVSFVAIALGVAGAIVGGGVGLSLMIFSMLAVIADFVLIASDLKKAYEAAKNELTRNPSDPKRRIAAVEAGRRYSTYLKAIGLDRFFGFFDEKSISNDIEAICVERTTGFDRASQVDDPSSKPQKLKGLRDSGLISEAKFEESGIKNELPNPKEVTPATIESVLNKQLNPKNITAKVLLRDDCLQIMLESKQELPKEFIVAGVKKLLNTIRPAGSRRAKVYCKVLGDDFPKWDEEFDFSSTRPSDSQPSTTEQKAELQSSLVRPIVQQHIQQEVPVVIPEVQVRCPKCGSTQINANKKGFSAGQAIVGGLLTGGIGLLGGMWGSNDLRLNCLRCGHKWKPMKGR